MFLEAEPEDPIPPNPSSMGAGDERTLEELSPEELEAAEVILFERFGVNRNAKEARLVRNYESFAPEEATLPGRIKVSVYRTKEEGVFLQELTFLDNAKRWVLGPNKDI